MMRLSRFFETFLALALAAWAQTPPLAESALTNQDVITLARAGFNEDFIIETISLSRTRFDTSESGVAALAKQGLTERIIRSMMAASAPPPAPAAARAASATPPAVTAPPASAPPVSAPPPVETVPAASAPPPAETAAPAPAAVPAASVAPWGTQPPPAAALPASFTPQPAAYAAPATPRAAILTPAAAKSPGDSAAKPAVKNKTYVLKPSAAFQAISTQTPYRESTSIGWGLWKKQVEVATPSHGEQVVAPALGEFFKQVRREANPSPAHHEVPARYVVLQ